MPGGFYRGETGPSAFFTGLKCSKITPLIFVSRWGKRLQIWDSERPIIWDNFLTLLKITPFLPAKSLKKIWIQLPPWLGWIYFYFLHTLEQYRTPAAWGCPNYARNSYGGWARSLAPPVHPRRDEGSPTHRGSVWNIRRTPCGNLGSWQRERWGLISVFGLISKVWCRFF